MIDFDTARPLPTGSTGWQELLSAISESDGTDETMWVEHKAGLDPSTKNGGAALAKAIVAFGNREVTTAARYLGGYGLIVVGMEPGSTPGITRIDPAQLRDSVDRFIAAPAPGWDSSHHTFQDKTVLVVTVDPPCEGDPVFVIGKAGGDPKAGESIRDGAIYVRRPGKSEIATSADIRRLEARRDAGLAVKHELDISVGLTSTAYAIPWLEDHDSNWVDRYVELEKTKMLEALEPAPRSAATGVLKAVRAYQRQMDVLGTRQEETRTKDEFRAEVEAWAVKAKKGLPGYLDDLRHHHASPLAVSVVNNTERNYAQLRVEIHIDGPILAYDSDLDEPRSLEDLVGHRPRAWGPWTKSRFSNIAGLQQQWSESDLRIHMPHPGTAPTVTITGNGETVITYPEFDLRPRYRATLDEVFLIADHRFAGMATARWIATAVNVDVLAEGSFPIQIADTPTSPIED